jgi:hypothetical protein
MAAESPGSLQQGEEQRPSGLTCWLRLGAGALLLLALSQTLWLWETWPVRELLPPPAPTQTPVAGR